MKELMRELREDTDKYFEESQYEKTDYLAGIDGLPKADVLTFTAKSGAKVTIRPSGTYRPQMTHLSFSGHTVRRRSLNRITSRIPAARARIAASTTHRSMMITSASLFRCGDLEDFQRVALDVSAASVLISEIRAVLAAAALGPCAGFQPHDDLPNILHVSLRKLT